MLGVLSARPKPWILASLFFQTTASAAHHHCRIAQSVSVPLSHLAGPRRSHSSACYIAAASCQSGGAASIWHAILPSSGQRQMDLPRAIFRGEGSWNAASDARPARWLHRADSAWMLFGVCACLSPVDWNEVVGVASLPVEKTELPCDSNDRQPCNTDYRVTGVLADGRCLFRAIAHSDCLRNGEEAPDDDRQRELADELRAKVVDELLRRREEIEWIIEGNFDHYIKRIQQPYVWGGEPELLMASHVIKRPISVYMVERSSDRLVNIAKYGEEYGRDEETTPINVLFHGYGHYDILDSLSDQSHSKVQVY